MLANVFDEDLTPGSNLPESGSDGLWIHLLPDLEPRHVAWICGTERPKNLVLAGAERTTVLEFDGGAEHGRSRRRSKLATSVVSRLAELDRPDVVVVPAAIAARIARDPELLATFAGGLAPAATVVVDGDAAASQARRHQRALERLSATLGSGGICELSTRSADLAEPSGGLAVPVTRPVRLRGIRGRAKQAARLIVTRASVLARSTPGSGARDHPSDIRLYRPVPVTRRMSRRSGVVLLRAGLDATCVPAYLVEMAARAGVDLARRDWAIAPPRGYRSQKVVFALTGGRGELDLIVKMTQESRFNARLDNERRALEHLTTVPAAHERSVPRLVFSGTHGGLLIVAETALVGRPFRHVSTARPGCPAAAVAVSWLTDLAAETVQRGEVRGPVLPAVDALVERFLTVFATSPSARRGLASVIEPLRSNPDAVPGVVSHGDPGIWNLVVGPDGDVGFLDWENFEPAGMPAWDLILFLRTFASFTAEATGRRPTPDVVLDGLCRPGPLNAFAQQTLTTYADRLDLDRELVPALVLTCWIHQALKEATRLAPGDRDRSRSRRTVARLLAEPALLAGLTGTRA